MDQTERGEDRTDCILVFDKDRSDASVLDSIAESVPAAVVTKVSTFDQYQQQLSDRKFDLVVLNCDLEHLAKETIFQELKLRDYDPGVLIVTPNTDPQLIAKMYDAGCDRCIVRSQGWADELGPAIRHLLRLRKLKEENLHIRAKLTEANHLLEEKNRRLDEFSMTVAHDIRGPLGGIAMKLEYVLENIATTLDDRSRQLLTRALESSQRLTDIVQAMYEYAKLGSKAAKMQEVSLKDLVQEVIGDLHFDEKLDISIGLGDLPVVWGNADLLRRVFINLISNAVKYNDKEAIVVNIGALRPVSKSFGQYIEIFVSDNGPGIPAVDLKNLFNMFSRGKAQLSKEGLGVGLAVVQRVIELHYGNVRVESKEGEGTRFLLTLPLEQIQFVS